MRGAKAGSKFYAVAVGRCPAIYRSWEACQSQVNKFKGSKFKSFSTLGEAEQYMSDNGAPATVREAPEPAEQPQPRAAAAAEQPVETTTAPQPLEAGAAKCSHEEAFQLSFTVAPNVLYRLEFDGAARNNPGPAGAGAVLYVDSCSDEVGSICVGLGKATNNVAEYTALVLGLEAAAQIGVQRLKVLGDSNLIVNQMNGSYKVRHEDLLPLFRRAQALSRRFRDFSIQHVYREHNKVADELSNRAIDTGGWAGLKTAQGLVPVASSAPSKARKLAAGQSAASSQMILGSDGLTRAPRKVPPLRPAPVGGSWAARTTAALAPATDADRRRLPLAARGCASAACQPAWGPPPALRSCEPEAHPCVPEAAAGTALGWQGGWGGRRGAFWEGGLPQQSRPPVWLGGEARAAGRQPRGLLALVPCRCFVCAAAAGQLPPACCVAPARAAAPAARSRLCCCTRVALRVARARPIV